MNKATSEVDSFEDDDNLGGDFSENKDYDCADWNLIRERKGWTEENKLRKCKEWWKSIYEQVCKL